MKTPHENPENSNSSNRKMSKEPDIIIEEILWLNNIISSIRKYMLCYVG